MCVHTRTILPIVGMGFDVFVKVSRNCTIVLGTEFSGLERPEGQLVTHIPFFVQQCLWHTQYYNIELPQLSEMHDVCCVKHGNRHALNTR